MSHRHTSNRGKQSMYNMNVDTIYDYHPETYPVETVLGLRGDGMVPSSSSLAANASSRPTNRTSGASTMDDIGDGDHDAPLVVVGGNIPMHQRRGTFGQGSSSFHDPSTWSNTISSTDSLSMSSIASIASLSFNDSDYTATNNNNNSMMIRNSSSQHPLQQQNHPFHATEATAVAGGGPTRQRRGRHHRRSPNMAMGSQEFYDRVLKEI